ncbi:MAG: putative PEP-binding protein, partial [Dictyoglomus sp.]
IRFLMKEKEILRAQIRAILKASTLGNVRILLPMVTLLQEIIAIKKYIDKLKKELKVERVSFDNYISIGIMVEVPSIALSLEEVIALISFVSIGSNDLIQYTFAADRTLEKVNYLYLPKHSAILKLIKHVINVCHENKKEVGVCGEIAGDLEMVTILAELEIDELSMAPTKIPLIKKILLNLLN